ncbi:MAG: integrase [Marine Group I thaumarchaeote]|nr:MAG: integrase [Marine Group I thaumarchaeote]
MKQKQLSEKKKEILVHDYDKIIEQFYSLIDRHLSKNNAELIRKYDRALVNDSLAKATRSKNLSTLLSLSRLLEKDWQDTTKEDIEDVVYKVNQKYSGNGQETNTTVDHKKILKRFYRWFKLGSRDFKEVGDPPETRWIRTRKVKDAITREQLISAEDLKKLLDVCGGNLRDRAFIHCHAEAGTRPGEILNLKIKHVKFDKYGTILAVDGKTGPRTVRLIKSTPDLADYLDKHPYRSDSNAPLWIMIGNKGFGEPLTYAAARRLMVRVSEKAGMDKRVYLNLFRHSEATDTANYLTEAQMKKRHGWSSTSKMPARYTHLINADVENAILSHYGIKKDKEIAASLPRICNVCQMPNSPESKLCTKCGKPLVLTYALELEEREKAEFEKERKEFRNKFAELENLKTKFKNDRKQLMEFKKFLQEFEKLIFGIGGEKAVSWVRSL